MHPTLTRLDDLARALTPHDAVLAVLGLGSAGVEHNRFTGARVVWQRHGIPLGLDERQARPPPTAIDTVDFHVNGVLTNPFVGLRRERRGERLTALRFIQVYAVDRVLALLRLDARRQWVLPGRSRPPGASRSLSKTCLCPPWWRAATTTVPGAKCVRRVPARGPAYLRHWTCRRGAAGGVEVRIRAAVRPTGHQLVLASSEGES